MGADGVMLLALAPLVFLMLFGPGRVIANEIARAAMLLVGVAVSIALCFLTAAFDFFVTFLMLLGVIAECDKRSICGRHCCMERGWVL